MRAHHSGEKRKLPRGFVKVPNLLVRNLFQLTPNARSVYLVLASYGKAYPSYVEIMKQTGLARGSVASAIKDLKQLGIVEYTRGGRHGLSNLYKILPMEKWRFDMSAYQTTERSLHELDKSIYGTPLSPSREPKEGHDLDSSKKSSKKENQNNSTTAGGGDDFFSLAEAIGRGETIRRRNGKELDEDELYRMKFFEQLTEDFSQPKFMKSVLSTIEDWFSRHAFNVELSEVLDFVSKNMNGKRAPFREQFLDQVEAKFLSVVNKIATDIQAGKAKEEHEKFMRELENEANDEAEF